MPVSYTHLCPAWRLIVPDQEISFTDGLQGTYRENLLRDCGDFILRRSDGVYAYQLAVVVDDAWMGVTLSLIHISAVPPRSSSARMVRASSGVRTVYCT